MSRKCSAGASATEEATRMWPLDKLLQHWRLVNRRGAGSLPASPIANVRPWSSSTGRTHQGEGNTGSSCASRQSKHSQHSRIISVHGWVAVSAMRGPSTGPTTAQHKPGIGERSTVPAHSACAAQARSNAHRVERQAHHPPRHGNVECHSVPCRGVRPEHLEGTFSLHSRSV